jgi:hypothetical protein
VAPKQHQTSGAFVPPKFHILALVNPHLLANFSSTGRVKLRVA